MSGDVHRKRCGGCGRVRRMTDWVADVNDWRCRDCADLLLGRL